MFAALISCFFVIGALVFPAAAQEVVTIRGNSLAPLLNPDEEAKVQRNYYQNYPIQRNDVVLIDHAGRKNSLIKIVKGLGGDELTLQKVDKGWNILINNKILLNSENKKYIINGKKYKMLSLYEGVIPKDACLVLGDNPSGSLDSTRFGLINKKNIIAKVNK